MSRSRRKTPIWGITTARSEKEDKRIANRRLRHRNNQKLRMGEEDIFHLMKEITDPWSMAKDGKAYHTRTYYYWHPLWSDRSYEEAKEEHERWFDYCMRRK